MLEEAANRAAHAGLAQQVQIHYHAAFLRGDLVGALALVGTHTIRCICDYWGDNGRKADPVIFEQIERLEFALTDKFPYKLLARNLQVIARKL